MKGNISTVFIVANDSSFQKGLRTLLEQGGGFDFCIEARSGSEAIEKVRHLLPNLVILDFSLPDMNGLQLAQEIRKMMPRMPIFMLTGDRDLHAEKDALSSGINAVFSKVEDLEALVENAREVCGIE
jgi:DNA-binding NarL/FixJ family response regulator